MLRNIVIVACCVVLGSLSCVATSARADEAAIGSLIGDLKSPDEAIRHRAIESLGAEGANAAEAVGPLTELLSNHSADVRAHAAWALGEIGAAAKPSVPAIIELLKDADESVRRQAIRAIIKIRPGPQVTIPLCVELMQDPDPGVCLRVLNSISELGAKAVPALIDALKNENSAYWACVVLREMGPVAKAAIPTLIEKLQDPRPEVRREAILALAAMDNEAEPAVDTIAGMLKDEATQVAATYALGRIGRIPPAAMSTIRANTKSKDAMLSAASYWALARLNPKDKSLRIETTQKLIALLKNDDPMVRIAAARSLAALPPAPEITAPLWEKAFADADETTIMHALDAMATLGPVAVPRLIEALEHEKIRGGAIYLLGRLGPAAATATGALAKLIEDKDVNIAKEAIFTLADIGPGAKDAVPALTKAMRKDDNPNVKAVVFALGKIGPDAVAAVPALLTMLKNTDPALAMESAWAAAMIQPGSTEVAVKTLPVLTSALSDASPAAREGAAEALGNLGPAAKDALPALQKAMNDDDKAVRDAAAKAVHLVRKSDSQ